MKQATLTKPKNTNSAANGPQIIECVQGEPEWFEARKGRPTASMFKSILAKGEGKMRDEYLRKVAGEILSGQPLESFSNRFTERGQQVEPEALADYELLTDATVRKVGLVVHRDGVASCSPDGLIGEDGGLEIKSMSPHLLIETLRADRVPPEHMAQIQGGMWVTERLWWDVVAFYPGMPMGRWRVLRNDAYIRTLEAEVRRFHDDLQALVEKIRAYGVR